MLFVPEFAIAYGFVNGPGGTHTSRTMMLRELRFLLESCAPDNRYSDYESAIIDDNVLLKQTASTRLRSLRALRELYGLRSDNVLFQAMRDLWTEEPAAQPALALLCAVARDPLLRATAQAVLATPIGHSVPAAQLAKAATEAFPGHYNASTAAKIGRNAASSWTQAGYLEGHLTKMRTATTPQAVTVAYALLQGHLCGGRGDVLFDTFWMRLLDAPRHRLRDLAIAASQAGFIDLRQAGAVTEITFSYLLRNSANEAPDP